MHSSCTNKYSTFPCWLKRESIHSSVYRYISIWTNIVMSSHWLLSITNQERWPWLFSGRPHTAEDTVESSHDMLSCMSSEIGMDTDSKKTPCKDLFWTSPNKEDTVVQLVNFNENGRVAGVDHSAGLTICICLHSMQTAAQKVPVFTVSHAHISVFFISTILAFISTENRQSESWNVQHSFTKLY